MMTLLRCLFALLAFTVLGACQTTDQRGLRNSRTQMLSSIRGEESGSYFIGRRYYKVDYKFWGFVRKPNQPWSSAQMVMFNEQQKLAPDRQMGKIGSDNNHEYKLFGGFSGQTVYEPASNGFYPEFVLKGYELRSAAPGNIFRTPGATDPRRRIIARPY